MRATPAMRKQKGSGKAKRTLIAFKYRQSGPTQTMAFQPSMASHLVISSEDSTWKKYVLVPCLHAFNALCGGNKKLYKVSAPIPTPLPHICTCTHYFFLDSGD